MEHSVPNKTGNNFSDINSSTGVINSSNPSIVRKKYVNFDRYPLMYAAYAACGCVSAISQRLFSSLDYLLTNSSQYSFLNASEHSEPRTAPKCLLPSVVIFTEFPNIHFAFSIQ